MYSWNLYVIFNSKWTLFNNIFKKKLKLLFYNIKYTFCKNFRSKNIIFINIWIF